MRKTQSTLNNVAESKQGTTLQLNKPSILAVAALAVALSMQPHPVHAQSVAGAVAANVAVGSLVTDIRNGIQEIISQLSADVSKNSFEMRQHLELVSQTIGQIGNGLVGKTFGELDTSQQRFFTNANVAFAQMKNGTDQTLQRVDAIAADANDALGTLPMAYRHPRALRFSPSYVVGASDQITSSQADVPVKVNGSWLGHGTPTFTFEGKKCPLMTKTESELVFDCPWAAFKGEPKTTQKTGTLHLEREMSTLEFIRNLFTKVPTDVEYKLGVFVVPPTMGTYTFSAKIKTSKVEEVVHTSQEYYYRNGHCEGAQQPVWTVNATPGWTIDPNSIEVTETTKNGDTQNHGAFNRGASGFQMGGIVRNTGNCIRVLGQLISKDARGWLGVRATYKETRTVEAVADAGPWDGTIYWGKDVSFQLPSDATSFSAQVNQVNGQIALEDKSASRKWFTLRYNETSKQVFIHPASLDNALQN